jgi:hypothetical protein
LYKFCNKDYNVNGGDHIKKFILGFISGIVLLASITVFASSEYIKRIDNQDGIGFYETLGNNYVGGIYIDPNTQHVVLASDQDRNIELNSSGDIFLNSKGKVYIGYLKNNDTEIVTVLQLKEEIAKLQKQIDELKK